MQNLVAVSHTVCAHVGGKKNFGRRCSPILPWYGDVLTPQNHVTSSHVLSHQILLLQVTVWGRQGSQKIWGTLWAPTPADRGVTIPLETCSCLTSVIPDFVGLGQTFFGVRRGLKEFWGRWSPWGWGVVDPQKHVLPYQIWWLQVWVQVGVPKIWGMLGPAPLGLGWLTPSPSVLFHQMCRSGSNRFVIHMGSYLFKIKGNICLKKFSFPFVFNAPAEKLPSEFSNGSKAHITEMMSLPESKKYDDNPFIQTQYRHWTDRQADGQNW